MGITKRFNSNYRKNFKGGSRKRIPKKGKRRLNKSKATKRRYKKSKNLKINRQLRNKRLQKGGGETALSIIFEVNESFNSIEGLWFMWIGKKKGPSLCKIGEISKKSGEYKVTIDGNILRNEEVTVWKNNHQYFEIVPGNFKIFINWSKLKTKVFSIGTPQGELHFNFFNQRYKDISALNINLEEFFNKFNILNARSIVTILDYFFLSKVVEWHFFTKTGFTLKFNPTKKIGKTALDQKIFKEFIESLNKITGGHSENASVNSTKMYYLIDDTKTKKFKIQSNLVITEYNHLSEDSFFKRTNFGDEMVMFTSDTTGTQEKSYSTYKQPNPLEFFIRKESTGKITLTYNSETYTVNDTLPDDTDDYILLE